MSTKNNKLRFIDEEKTEELQKDWKDMENLKYYLELWFL